jgi:hypothetical protein
MRRNGHRLGERISWIRQGLLLDQDRWSFLMDFQINPQEINPGKFINMFLSVP